jgi:hypothetical protein
VTAERRGLGLVEVLIVSVCLLVSIGAILAATATGRQAHYRAEHHAVARYLALEAVEYLHALPIAAVRQAVGGTTLAGVLPVTSAAPSPRPEWRLSGQAIPGAAGGLTYRELAAGEAFPDFHRTVTLTAESRGTAARPQRAVRALVQVFWWEKGQEGRAEAQRTLAVSTLVLDRESVP